ncbi:MAG: hypothetical protein P4L86_22195, partial [Mycobacterium sp.]|nr:hypothetical protein [Mycobacterium sp.]
MSIDPGTGVYGSWVSYAASSAITLPVGDGTKTVRVQYKDNAGNIATMTDTIVLDATTPAGTMSVNNNATYATSTSASVNSTVTDAGSGVSQMRIDPGTGIYGSWIAYAASSPVTLPSGDGTKTVNVQYRDGAGNVATLTDTIKLDTTGPTGTMVVNADAAYTNVVAATINATMTDAGSSVTQMNVDPGTGVYGGWIAYNASYAITLSAANGTKTINVQYRDANNFTTTKTDTIVLDTAAPTGTMSVNNGAAITATLSASVNSTVTDALSGLSQMRIDPGTGTYGSWVSYAASSAITLPSGDGTKTVNVQYRDNASNVLTLTDTIMLQGPPADTTAPTTTSDAQASYVGTATINLTAIDNVGGSGVAGTAYTVDAGAVTTGTVVTVGAVGTHTLKFWSVDNAGNKEVAQTATFDVARGASFAFTGSAQSLVVPAGVTTLTVDLYGGAGGDFPSYEGVGGLGGHVHATISVTPGDVLSLRVGAKGADGNGGDVIGGWPNGGSGTGGHGAAGGGSTSIIRASQILAEAGAGGGAGDGGPPPSNPDCDGGPGGAQGTLPGGNQAGETNSCGGGGGWNGGAGSVEGDAAGADGGTSYIAVGTGLLDAGVRTGNGVATVTWATPDLTAPVTTSDAAASYSGPATIHLTPTDVGGSGVASTSYTIDNGAQSTGTSLTVSALGTHTLRFWSVDGAGNV